VFIGAYFCVTGLLFVLGLLVLAALPGQSAARQPAKRTLAYAGLSFSVALLGLIAFIGLSYLTGLMSRGQGVWSYPNDYLAYRPVGWVIMLIPLIGVLSPLVVLLWLRSRSGADGGQVS
jgi:hypothetical protein